MTAAEFTEPTGSSDVFLRSPDGISRAIPSWSAAAGPRQLAAALRQQLQRWEGRREGRDCGVISSGCVELDRLLPAGGLARGSLVECLAAGARTGGVGTVAMILARQAAREGGALVVLDPRHWFYPPGAAVLGVPLERVVVVRAWQGSDQIWAIDQALRCPAVAAVWAPLEELQERDFRRLQLAAEAGGGVGILVRGRRFRDQPSWSDVQLLIAPRALESQQLGVGRRLRIELLRCRQGRGGGGVEVEIVEQGGVLRQVSSHHEASTVYPTASLAPSAAGGCSA